MRDRYRSSGDSVQVDFRDLVPGVGATERATHMLHPYPAKLLRHIPAFAVAAPQLSPPEGLILDPFCGSGTTLVEAFISDRPAIGIDINPLAALISRVKTTPIDVQLAQEELQNVVSTSRRLRPTGFSSQSRLSYWYPPRTLADLSRLTRAIARVEDGPIRDLLSVAVSNLSRSLSYANPRVSVPVRLKPEAYKNSGMLRKTLERRLKAIEHADAIGAFSATFEQSLERIDSLGAPVDSSSILVACGDARSVCVGASPVVEAESVDLVLTSPPYLGAQKYIRATSLNQLCLDLSSEEDLLTLQEQSIGREHFRKDQYAKSVSSGVPAADRVIEECREQNPLRAHLAASYLSEMREALGSAARVLRSTGHLVLVAGGNQLCGRDFDTPRFLRDLCEDSGLTIEVEVTDTIRSRGLMTRRNREASPIATERVMIFRK